MFAQFQTPRESGGSTEEFAEWDDGGTPATEVGTTPGSTLRPPSGEKQEHQQPSPAAAAPHPYSTTNKSVSSSRSFSSTQDATEETSSVTSSMGGSPNSRNVHSLFNKAYEYLNPGCSFRSVVHLYAERKLLVFFLIHFACTMIIWFHFGLEKFEKQKLLVPVTAPSYWWKRIVPPLEFGAMHAILFQLALIPLTMARYSISTLSGSVLDRFIPLNRMLRMHIHLGYTMVTVVFFATLLFFAFFGVLCGNGEQDFCDKFRSEIMCTGYGILACLLIVAGTSYFRHVIPYEVFYVVHHLVFVMYAITIAHTFDIQSRTNQAERSQTFKWFSATVLYYVCDRLAMHLNHKYRARLLSSSTVSGSNGSKMIILKLRRPALFRFKPGQYAYLRVGKIDKYHWHPFSIGSDPSSSHLQFYVEVYDEKSWTGKLWSMLQEDADFKISYRQIDIEIMGPIGTALAKTEDYSHVLAVGTGTGIVPVLSLFKQQIHELMRLDPDTHFRDLKNHRQKVHEVESAGQDRQGSFVHRAVRSCRVKTAKYQNLDENTGDCVRESIKNSIARRGESLSRQELRTTMAQMKIAAWKATRSIYGTVLLSILPVIGITLIGLMISWNTISVELYDGMTYFLKCFTVGFQGCFAIVALFILDSSEFLTYVDIVLTIIAPFADWYWLLQCEDGGTLNNGDLTQYCLLTGYMLLRLWSMAVIPRHRSWKTRVENGGVMRTMERFDFVWVTRSASLVAEILPDINEIWESLVSTWGEKNAAAVCRISIHVTDKDEAALEALQKEFGKTSLFKGGCIHYGRPDFSLMIQNHTIELIASRRYSHSLLAYVGSPALVQEIHHSKISNDMVTAITGHTEHQMEFVAESYGGTKHKPKTVAPPSLPTSENESSERNEIFRTPRQDRQSHPDSSLSVRKTTSYEDGSDTRSLFRDGSLSKV